MYGSGGIESGIVDNVQVVDANTVKFVLKQPVSTFLYKLTGFEIIPEHIYEKVSDPASFLDPEAVIGTGPFLLDEYNKRAWNIPLCNNENFWDLRLPLNRRVCSGKRFTGSFVEQGEIDFTSISPDTLDGSRQTRI
jgi:peptide/nickel transport system substrate-binding protein